MVDSAEFTAHTVAGIPLLETKFYIPRWRSGLVSRPRLLERLNQGAERKLLLVSAPAGFGKTTLLAEWLADSPAREEVSAWVSLDKGDNDPIIFWTYFITSLKKIQADIGDRSLSLLHSPRPAPIESVLTTLINELNGIEDDFVLILDDFHLIDAQSVHSAVDFLLEHLPPQMHLVVASRSDPSLPLPRLRARGESTELRAIDLCFTPDEAAAFLNEVMGLGLSAADVASLETRTEGWIAGLQLAALSMQGRDDVPGFIRAFAGDDRYIVDYLVEEVLQRQTEEVRSFLLQTSILERLSGPLCDAVTSREDGKVLLEALERSNLFVVPLDDKRQWYRYHHLFADVLQSHSTEEQPDGVLTLHLRASEWFEQNGLPVDAIRHALAAEDFERAAALIELAWISVFQTSEDATWLKWVKALPDELVRVRPVLSVGYGWTLLVVGEFEAGEARLRDAERWLDTKDGIIKIPEFPPDEMVVVDEEQFQHLPAALASARAFLSQGRGDFESVEKYAKRALDLYPKNRYFERAIPSGILGLAYWAQGDLEEAYRLLAEGMNNLRMNDNIDLSISGTSIFAYIRMAQGRLRDAVSTYEQAVKIASEWGGPVIRGTADLYLGLSELQIEQGNLQAAIQNLTTSEELGEQAAMEVYQYRSRITQARLKEVQGDLVGALEMLDDAERVYTDGVAPNIWPVAALKARIWIKQGKLAQARNWAREQSLTVNDDLSYLREFEHITLARLLIAQYRSEHDEPYIRDACALLECLLKEAEEGGRIGSVIEILVLQALAYEAQDNIPHAIASLERALKLAEPEGHVTIFVDEGEAMRDLLREVVSHGTAISYSRHLLSYFSKVELPDPPSMRAVIPDLAEPLTAREVEILGLIASGMRNQEIADHLFISLATVKRHIANAYGKLGVSHRTEAIARANELNLL